MNKQRRLFLKALGLGTATSMTPLLLLANNLLRGSFQKALASESGVQPRRFLNIFEYGAPPRWMYNQFFTPYNKNNFVPAPHIGTQYVDNAGRYTGVTYETVSLKGLNVPPIWQSFLPASAGGSRPMADLLDNMLCLQGIDIGAGNHSRAINLNFHVLGASQSLMAMAADYSELPIPAINAGTADFIFRSLTSKAFVYIARRSQQDLISELMSPFIKRTATSYNSKKASLDSFIKAATTELNRYATSQNPMADIINESLTGASELIERSFADLPVVWNNLFNKYTALIRAAEPSNGELLGINDKPIGKPLTQRSATDLDHQHLNTVVDLDDLRDIILPSVKINMCAEHFALAEYVLMNDLSHSITISPRNLQIKVSSTAQQSLRIDEHNTGGLVTLIGNTMRYRALAACKLELIDRLKSAGIYGDTIILTGGEFNRVPRNDASGSDHGSKGGSYTIHSGIVSGPLVLGELAADADGRGTWGYHGPQNRDLGHIVSTLAELLKVPSPIGGRTPMVQVVNGVVSPLAEKTNLVVI